MSESKLTLPVEHVSDTAWMVAEMRAVESERTDAKIRDPLARRLVGERGKKILERFPEEWRSEWLLTLRTHTIDQIILRQVSQGVNTVVNLAAGLDTRPYRLALPPQLRWVEVDFPAVIAYKSECLAGEPTSCRLERISQDLANDEARRALLRRYDEKSRHLLVLTEGLLSYLSEPTVVRLAEDLHALSHLDGWLMDSFDGSFLQWAQRGSGAKAPEGKTELHFMPSEGHEFFHRYGWQTREFHCFEEIGRQLDREPPPAWRQVPGSCFRRSGVALLRREISA